MRLKKKLTKDEIEILLHDLECLELKKTKDNKYHYDLLRNNLKDLGGLECEPFEFYSLEEMVEHILEECKNWHENGTTTELNCSGYAESLDGEGK